MAFRHHPCKSRGRRQAGFMDSPGGHRQRRREAQVRGRGGGEGGFCCAGEGGREQAADPISHGRQGASLRRRRCGGRAGLLQAPAAGAPTWLRSKEWVHFDIIESDEKGRPAKARCKRCEIVLMCDTRNGTSVLRNHLKCKACRQKRGATDPSSRGASGGHCSHRRRSPSILLIPSSPSTHVIGQSPSAADGGGTWSSSARGGRRVPPMGSGSARRGDGLPPAGWGEVSRCGGGGASPWAPAVLLLSFPLGMAAAQRRALRGVVTAGHGRSSGGLGRGFEVRRRPLRSSPLLPAGCGGCAAARSSGLV